MIICFVLQKNKKRVMLKNVDASGCYYYKISEEEVEKVLEELDTVRPEMLNDKAKRLFDAIMKIADERAIYAKFIDAISDLDPMTPKAITLGVLYEHIETAVKEFHRLEDLEDTKLEMLAHIDKLQEELKEARDNLYSANQIVGELLDDDHIPRID